MTYYNPGQVRNQPRSPKFNNAPPTPVKVKDPDNDSCFYEEIRSFPDSSSQGCVTDLDTSQKLDEILTHVRNIDKHICTLYHPPRPPKPSSGGTVEPVIKKATDVLELPPPRPPKGRAGTIELRSKTFSATQCQYLATHVRNVRKFVDENFEDEFVDKDDNMIALNTVLKALTDGK